MIGNYKEIQWPDQLHRLASVGNDCLAARHTEAIMHVKCGSDETCIEGKFGMEMRIAEEHLVCISPVGVWLINALIREIVFGDYDFLRHCRR